MCLRQYFENHPEITQKKFAELIGCVPEEISMLVAGKRKASPQKCILIEEATNGEVPVESMRPDFPWAKFKNILLQRMINKQV